MADWADKANDQLEQELEDGELTPKEFKQQQRMLRAELEEAAQDAAQEAYDNY